MKSTLEFNLPEEREELMMALNGNSYFCRLDDIWQNLFRPRHKHGYSNPRINEILEKCPEANELMDFLEKEYMLIKNEE